MKSKHVKLVPYWVAVQYTCLWLITSGGCATASHTYIQVLPGWAQHPQQPLYFYVSSLVSNNYESKQCGAFSYQMNKIPAEPNTQGFAGTDGSVWRGHYLRNITVRKEIACEWLASFKPDNTLQVAKKEMHWECGKHGYQNPQKVNMVSFCFRFQKAFVVALL